ncbi:hypothetical protein HYV74_00225 [Candidatus Uhrbacteria bacterium]|nr:hypothetical protein [Candidatus Uhrbacteria bacterium]
MDQLVTKRNRRTARTATPPAPLITAAKPAGEAPSTLALLVAGLSASIALSFAAGGDVWAGIALTPQSRPAEPSRAQIFAEIQQLHARLENLETTLTASCRTTASADVVPDTSNIEPPPANQN